MKFDKIKETTTILANISQVIIVFVAIFGYFYTVIPVYQKELLAEAVSSQQRTIGELEQKNKNIMGVILENELILSEQKTLINSKQTHIDTLTARIDTLRKENDSYVRDRVAINATLRKLQADTNLRAQELKFLESKVSQHYRIVFIENMKMKSAFLLFKLHSNEPLSTDKYSEEYIKAYSKKFPTPYECIKSSLDNNSHGTDSAYSIIPESVIQILSKEFSVLLEEKTDLKNLHLKKTNCSTLLLT